MPLLYSATVSADGFIAGPGGDMSWLAAYVGEADPLVDGLVPRIGAILAGARTFGGDDPHRGDPEHEGAFGGAWHGPQFVLTHHPPARPVPGTGFHTDLPSAVAAARAAAGDSYVNVLGASVARQCLEAGELDEVLLFAAPVFLGGGTRVFDRPDGPPVRLERLLATQTPHAVGAWYRVAR